MELGDVGLKPEIEHIGNFDIIVNRQQTSIGSGDLAELRESLEKSAETQGAPLKSWATTGYEKMVDSKANPKYFAKIKWAYKGEMLTDRALRTNRWRDVDSSYFKKLMYTTNSLLNEMFLSSQVKKIVESKEVQEVLEKIGVKSIDFIEPLIGVINKKTKRKYMIYRFIKGDIFAPQTDDEFDEVGEVIADLEQILKNNGINPIDIGYSQILVEKDERGDKHFHLLDSEQYQRIKQPVFSK